MRDRFGFVFNGRVFLCEPFQYSTRGILLLEEQAFTAKTGKKIIEKHFIYFCVLLIFRFCKQLEKFDTTILMYLLLLMYLLPVP